MKIRVIVNPKAGAGAAGRKAPIVSNALRERGVEHEIVETRGPSDATRIASEAFDHGFDVLAVIGGDGTLNEVAQAYLDSSGVPRKGPDLALIPAGTGSDFRRVLDAPSEPGTAVERLLASRPRPVDLGIVEIVGERDEPLRRAFVNIASFGVSGRIDRLVNQSPKWIGGRLAFAWGTVKAMATYRNAPIRVEVDGRAFYEGRTVVGAVASGAYFGGGMHIAPRADPSDGLLDIVLLGDLSFAEAASVAPAVYAGTHLGRHKVLSTRGTIVTATPLDDTLVYVDTDGESPGRLPLRASIAPRALSFRV